METISLMLLQNNKQSDSFSKVAHSITFQDIREKNQLYMHVIMKVSD